MIVYIIKSIICSSILMAVYFMLLQREKTYQFNRFYLLLVIPLSFVIPLVTFELKSQDSFAPDLAVLYQNETPAQQTESMPVALSSQPETSTTVAFPWLTLLTGCYCFITVLLLIRFGINLFKMFRAIRSHSSRKIENASLIIVEQLLVPHTFLHYIFISPEDAENKQILTHELTHAKQKHSLDILFIEILQCLFWINPVLIFIKKAIRLNHEFIADEAVVSKFAQPADYQQLLLAKVDPSSQSSFVSSFSYSLTKKRFVMMLTPENLTRSALKITMTVVITGSVTLLFSEKVYSKGIYQNNSIATVDTVKGATPETMLEFEILLNQYGIINKKYGDDQVAINRTELPVSEANRMKEIYEAMTSEQKSKFPKSIYYVMVPVPNPAKKAPTRDQLSTWKDVKLYGVWLDGKRISNAEAAKLKSADLSFYKVSKLLDNAAHYGEYKYQVDLMTESYFDKTYPAKSK